jgi:hypothetical protein
MMTLSHDIHDIAGAALYRTLLVRNSNFDNVIKGLKLKDYKGTWPNDASHERKVRLLGFVRHLVLVGLPRGRTATRLINLFPSSSSTRPLFCLAKTAAITDSFMMCVARYAILKAPGISGNNVAPPHPFLEFLQWNTIPTAVCISLPLWEDRDSWVETFDVNEVEQWLVHTEFSAQLTELEENGILPTLLRHHFLGIIRAEKEQKFADTLISHWKPITVTLHNFDFGHATALPQFNCRHLRVFACDAVCDQHPDGVYSHQPYLHAGNCLANRGSYWCKVREMLKALAVLPPWPDSVELSNVGTTFMLACGCQATFNDTMEEYRSMLRSSVSDEFSVKTPHWSEVSPCASCTEPAPWAPDTLHDAEDEPMVESCVSLVTKRCLCRH